MDDSKLERSITLRFVELASLQIGPGRRWPYKIDFCGEMDMFYQELHMFETGKRNVKFRHLVKFHELTGADMNFMILGKKLGRGKDERVVKILQDAIKLLK